MENRLVNHSGGCPGADMMWENEGYKHGIKSIAYSFPGHKHESKNPKILTPEELNEGWEHVKQAEKSLKRTLHYIQYNPYVRNLLCRNWFQVKNAECIYAIGSFVNESNPSQVNGGTGWAVQMAIDNDKSIYLFDQKTNSWYRYSFVGNIFVKIDTIPNLTNNFAGIGTRQLDINGENAIKEILKYNINHG